MQGSDPRPTVGRAEALSFDLESDGLAVLRIDAPGQRLNLLRASLIEELDFALDALERVHDLRAVVLASGKQDHFLAGADLRMLKSIRFASEGAEMAHLAQHALDRLNQLPVPVVAAIHGACLGGGLELALACHGRVASSDETTRLGLPEVELGLLPALGGTQRLPRLVGLRRALDLMLSGSLIDAMRAARIGLVDEVVAPSILLQVATERALQLAARSRPKRRSWGVFLGVFGMRGAERIRPADNLAARKLILARARRRVLKQTHRNCPAADRILDAVEVGLDHGVRRGQDAEAKAFGELVTSPQAAQLINLFFAQRSLNKELGVDDRSVQPGRLSGVGIVAADPVGAEIALVTAARARLPVRLRYPDHTSIGESLRAIQGRLESRVARLQTTPQERDRILARISAATDFSGFGDATVIIDSATEKPEGKHELLRALEPSCSPEAILASNSVRTLVSDFAAASSARERVVGMHYLQPVHRARLVEVVITPWTRPAVVATCVQLALRQKKTAIVVRDGAGFYVSRILAPFLLEAMSLLAAGLPIERIDGALVDWGFASGPLARLDAIGLPDYGRIVELLRESLGERMAPPQGLLALLESGRRGRAAGQGFYLYRRGRQRRPDRDCYALLGVRPNETLPAGEIVQRCVLRMVNEAVLCFSSATLRSARDGDLGAVLGAGFPAFRGGPFRYVDEVGAEEIVRRLRAFEKQHGLRFSPAPLLVRMAAEGQTFHGERIVQVGDA
jgi:3-hydroxyacyl-CoA dehydrogenase/enoyl-CoA hydratase/3-hydroxybutyryl-CoA epimerase